MLTSNFELLVSRIANVPGPPSITAPFRKVITGHFLTVSNLDPARTINLFLRMTITTSVGNRTIVPSPPASANVQFIFDNGSAVNNSIRTISLPNGNANSTSFNTGVFSLAPHQTGLVAILPVVTPAIVANPDLEIRGYIELRQSRSNGGPFIFLGAIPAAEILFTPETRGTFLDEAYPTPITTDELDFDQIAYALPTANGKAKDTVEALPAIIFDFGNRPTRDAFKLKNPTLLIDEADAIFDNINEVMVMQGNKPKK
jgi:hypothetical protein